MKVHVHPVVDRTTRVTVTAEGNFTGTGEGTATCLQDDVFNRQTGILIATGRAFQDLGRQIEAEGHDRVTTKAEVRRVLRELGLNTGPVWS